MDDDAATSADPFLTLIAGLAADSPPSGFYSSLCESICQAVDLDRAVLFQYDTELRRGRPLGGYGIDPDVAFGDAYVDPDTARFVREAFEHDAVIEIGGSDLAAATPSAFKTLTEGRRAVCVPVTSAGRWVGLLLADRAETAPVLTARERALLLSLGKALALAAMARRVTRRHEQERMLRQRVEMARDVHDGVVQRLFGVSLALAGDGPLSAEDRARCGAEIEAAMEQLRDTVAGRQPTDEPHASEPLADLLRSWQVANDDVDLRFDAAELDAISTQMAPVVRSAVIEALRNARKHADVTWIEVRASREDDALVVEVVNDGARGPGPVGEPGAVHRDRAPNESASRMGLRLLSIEALQAGGLLEHGARDGSTWGLRLLLPHGDA